MQHNCICNIIAQKKLKKLYKLLIINSFHKRAIQAILCYKDSVDSE